MSRAERAGRAKKMNNSHCPALMRRRRGEAAPSGEAASWLSDRDIGREKSLPVYYAFRLISCQPRLGTRPGGLGKLQAVTNTNHDRRLRVQTLNLKFGTVWGSTDGVVVDKTDLQFRAATQAITVSYLISYMISYIIS
jgi:hypothetical protein